MFEDDDVWSDDGDEFVDINETLDQALFWATLDEHTNADGEVY